jgi:hypothetical protein
MPPASLGAAGFAWWRSVRTFDRSMICWRSAMI